MEADLIGGISRTDEAVYGGTHSLGFQHMNLSTALPLPHMIGHHGINVILRVIDEESGLSLPVILMPLNATEVAELQAIEDRRETEYNEEQSAIAIQKILRRRLALHLHQARNEARTVETEARTLCDVPGSSH